ncbi:MAG: hypothetical protein JSS49_19240 [Planctomycetes bacterium]|nr:hypothetical protein [Planctomycetota bacterium]
MTLVAGRSLLFVVMAIGFGIGAWLQLRGKKHSAPSPVVRPRSNPRYLLELSWLTAPVVVLSTFTAITSIHGSGSESRQSDNGSKHGQQARLQSTAIEPRIVPVTAESLAQRPDWVHQGRTNDGVCERVVLISQQYSTREEAAQELTSSATELLLQDLQRLYPGEARPRNWHPTSDEIQRVAVKQQYVEAVDRDFGTFTHPMYRVWWQLELSPEIRTEFLPSWRRGLTKTRITHVGIALSTLVLVASLVAMYRQLDVQSQGKSRWNLGTLTGLIAILWWMAIRFVPV